jgi:hypothetical protein
MAAVNSDSINFEVLMIAKKIAKSLNPKSCFSRMRCRFHLRKVDLIPYCY